MFLSRFILFTYCDKKLNDTTFKKSTGSDRTNISQWKLARIDRITAQLASKDASTEGRLNVELFFFLVKI